MGFATKQRRAVPHEFVLEAIERYAELQTTDPPDLLVELERHTRRELENHGMLTGKVEGRLLKLLTQLTGARRALEIGMFTGYGTLSIAEGLPEDGELVSCEADAKHAAIARSFFARSPHGKRIRILEGDAKRSILELRPPFDFIFVDADKTGYPAYFEESLRLLRPGGVIAFDNMLWSGRVLDPKDDDTRVIHALNRMLKNDRRVEAVCLTIRDGVQLVRKR